MATIRAGYDSWLNDGAFVTDYTVRYGRAEDFEAALAGDFEPRVVDGKPFTLRGRVAKQGDRMRVFAEPSVPPEILAGGSLRGLWAFDESAAGDVTVTRFLPTTETSAQKLNYAEAATRAGVPGHTAGRLSGGVLSPITFGGGIWMTNPFDLDEMASVTAQSVTADADRVTVRQTYDLSGKPFRQTAVWDVAASPSGLPRLLGLDIEDETGRPGTLQVSRSLAGEFVETPTGPVPGLLRQAVGRNGARDVEVTEWRATNGGAGLRTEPVADDFRVPVPDGVPIYGLIDPPTGTGRSLSPLDLTPAALRETADLPRLEVVPRNLAAAAGWGPTVAWAAVAAAAAGIVAVLWRRRRA